MVEISFTDGFEGRLGLELGEVGGDRVTGSLDAGPSHQQPYGIVHGGVYCAMIETLASVGAATWAMERGMVGAVGLHNATDFVRSHRSGRLLGEAIPLHQGRTQQLWRVEIRREADGKLVAQGQVRLQNLAEADAIGGMQPPGTASAPGTAPD